MLRIVGERPIRVTYDRGTMEVFMPSFGPEDDAHLLGRMAEILADERDIAVKAGRTTTHKRRDLDRGAEPDQCYWFGENARHMIGKRQLDLTIDPRPDLVIEVDVTSSSLERLPLFAAMGVPEVWRLTPRTLEFLHLQPDGTYQARDQSRNFPDVPATEIARFVALGRGNELTSWARSFRDFVRAALIPRPEARAE
jgi:Uma2 family endonuclease